MSRYVSSCSKSIAYGIIHLLFVCEAHKRMAYKGEVPRMIDGTQARDRMIAAYALVCVKDTDLDVFKQYLDEYTKELMEAVARDLLTYLGMEEGVSVEVVHLDSKLREKLEQSGKLEEYLLGKQDNDS